ncbi:hypothetical protein PMAYCL1PPCAC_19667 [Pristionchus mayeri]|uniref:Galectin n=1 Tax=Pristionchus mayeri TaxID=1317129 RepID=A0AAN5CRX5_9BILA|nr:hypothetical protein PMAYCL1PPCAC_19667 [Pristionchus mayeri]
MTDLFNPPSEFSIGGFGVGRTIRFTVEPHNGAAQFTINLKTASDFAFYFFVNYKERYYVCSYTKDKILQTGKRIDDNFPFPAGKSFILQFVRDEGGINVKYGDRILTSFIPRELDSSKIRTVQIQGEVRIDLVTILH